MTIAAPQQPWRRRVTPLSLDFAGCRMLRSLPHAGGLDRVLVAASRATDHAAGWMVLGLGGAALDRGNRGRWCSAAVTVAAAEWASVIVKRRVGRERPRLPDLPPLSAVVTPLSFPSAHTATAFAAVVAFDGLLPSQMLRALAAAYAISRPYLGVHYPSDVLAGAALGWAVAAAARA